MKRVLLFILVPFFLGCSDHALPGLQSKSLGSGVKLFVLERPTLPISAYFLLIKSGSARDPVGKEGLANLTIEMLLRGTNNRSRGEILEDIDYLGASLSPVTSYDYIQLSGMVLAKSQNKFVELLGDVLLNPTFPTDEFEKLKSDMVGKLQLIAEDDRSLAKVRYLQFLFQGHPYGRPTTGTPESIAAITLDDVKEFYRKYFVKGNVVLAASGDIRKSELKHAAKEYISDLPGGDIEVFKYPPLNQITKNRILLVDKPDRTQTQIFLGYYGLSGDNPDYYPLYVANAAFGGTFTARMMQEVRVKRGWSYGASSRFGRRKSIGEFFTFTFPANKDTVPTIELTEKLLKEMGESGLGKEEFEMSKNYSVRERAFDTETPEHAMSLFLDGYVMGWSGYPADQREKLSRVSFNEVQQVSKKYFYSTPFVMTMVCTAADFKKVLEEKFPGAAITVVPYNKWELPK